ncbi:DUF7260 family protein [Halobiforma nitratireducens]|uniref:DUF7260 domain-containing protein n=1 Tax=Halobiforma nitratireducens JCM 10879 TaxID=1227454 RepID=M0LSS2_9EURY|nr:hypothetical protein [Halobiforma nitratireducens]EMA35449.1 hypothetical protein C446_12177 [Halobiforma nitratireducens JCM 10879]
MNRHDRTDRPLTATRRGSGRIETKWHLPAAIDCLETEQTHVEDKLAAVGQFEDAIEEIEPVREPAARAHATDGGVTTISHRRSELNDRCRRVRALFADTVRSYSIEDVDGSEPLLETIRAEFGDEIAIALAPSTASRFTPPVKQAIRSATRQRREELETMARTLTQERESLESTAGELEQVAAATSSMDPASLLELGFDELAERHENLETQRERCRRLCRKRQTQIHQRVGRLSRDDLAEFLYSDLSVSYPVLATAIALSRRCLDSQRLVRDHLVRRV